MAADLSKPGVDFSRLRQRPTTVYVMLHPLEVRKNPRWTRLIVSSALCALMRPGKVSTLFVLDEFRATVGNLPILNDVWSLVRGYGIQLLPILQSATQLQALFKDEWENYAGQAGIVATLGPANGLLTANWMSERCGVTTALKAGVNYGDGVNEGDGLNDGSGTTGAGTTTNQGNGKNYGRNRSGGISYQQTEQKVLKPQQIRDILAGHGLMWVPGMGTKTIPFYAPNWWDRDAEWAARVKKIHWHRASTWRVSGTRSGRAGNRRARHAARRRSRATSGMASVRRRRTRDRNRRVRVNSRKPCVNARTIWAKRNSFLPR